MALFSETILFITVPFLLFLWLSLLPNQYCIRAGENEAQEPSSSLHNFGCMCRNAPIRAHIGGINVVIGRMSQELSNCIARTTKGKTGIRVWKFCRNAVTIAYIGACIVQNHGQEDPKQPKPKGVEILDFKPCLGRRSCFPFGMVVRII